MNHHYLWQSQTTNLLIPASAVALQRTLAGTWRKITYLYLFVFWASISFAQKFDNAWVLGYENYPTDPVRMKIHFLGDTLNIDTLVMKPTPAPFIKVLNLLMTNSTMSDSLGNVLFYTNGAQVYGKNDSLMVNGDSLVSGAYYNQFWQSGFNIAQSTLILPLPNHPNLYYLFHNTIGTSTNTYEHPKDLYYSVIDMNQVGGNGAVIQKRQIAIHDTLTYGGITACKHANGWDWWILVPKRKSGYFSILLTPDGIKSVKLQHLPQPITDYDMGAITFSPDGTKYIRCATVIDKVFIFDFDRCNG